MPPAESDPDPEKKVRINVQTTRATRSKWKEYASENEDVNNLTHLIHRGVSEYISRQSENGDTLSQQPQAQEGGGVNFDRLAQELESSVQPIQEYIESVDERLAALEEELTESADSDLAAQVVHRLPPFRPESDEWEQAQAEYGPSPDDPSNVVVWSGRPADVAQEFDVPEERIDAVFDTVSGTEVVDMAVVNGETRYWSNKSAAIERYADEDPNARFGNTEGR